MSKNRSGSIAAMASIVLMGGLTQPPSMTFRLRQLPDMDAPSLDIQKRRRKPYNSHGNSVYNGYVPPKAEVNSIVRGSDRNGPCPCGCGRKAKKCHLGHATAPSHTLSIADYTAKVRGLLITEGLDDTRIDQYVESHIQPYCRDAVITPERCAELVLDMIYWEENPITA